MDNHLAGSVQPLQGGPVSPTGYSPICAKNANAETRASRCSVIIAPPTLMTEMHGQYSAYLSGSFEPGNKLLIRFAKIWLKTHRVVQQET